MLFWEKSDDFDTVSVDGGSMGKVAFTSVRSCIHFCHVVKKYIFISLQHFLKPSCLKCLNSFLDKKTPLDPYIGHQIIHLIIKCPTLFFCGIFEP